MVSTPIVTGSDCEGAGELFRVSTLDLNNLPRDDKGSIDYNEDFFGKETFNSLRRSMQKLMPVRYRKSIPSVRHFALRTPIPAATWLNFGWLSLSLLLRI